MMRTPVHARRSNGFTLVELAVVILIISMLLVMAVPSVNKAIIQAKRDTSFAIVSQLDDACQLFYIDHEFFPRSEDVNYPGWTGSQLLRIQLTGYGPDDGDDGSPGNGGDNSDLSTLPTDDGVPGLGFRKGPQGTTYGPYGASADMDAIMLGQWTVFPDAFGHEIFYYRYEAGGYDDAHNNPLDIDGEPLVIDTYAENPRSTGSPDSYDPGESLWRRDFLLFSAGPDGQFLTGGDIGAQDAAVRAFHPDKPFRIDDVTNFASEIGS